MKKHKDRNKSRKKNLGNQKTTTPTDDPIATLRNIIQDDIARLEKKKALTQHSMAPAPTPKELLAKNSANTDEKKNVIPQIETRKIEKVPMPQSTAKDQAATPTKQQIAQIPDFTAMTTKIMQIAARSQKLVNAFMERNKTLKTNMPSMDPAHLGQAFTDFTGKILSKPDVFVETQIAFWQDYVKLMKSAVAASSGKKMDEIITIDPADKRFKDPAWQEVWVFDFIKQSYLLMARWSQSLIDHVDGLDPKIVNKVAFYTHQMVDALSPTNFWLTNPEVLRTTIETHGENLINGLEHLLADLERGNGQLMISMSDNSAFEFGRNIATTKGKVVYQNDLMQLIQYSPLTEKAHKTPLLITPPWINKFYILDLKAENSFIHYLVEQGHTVFCISWVNPDSRHAKMNFDDYMMLGPVAAATEIKKITGENKVNCVGYCIGGTLLSCMMGWLAGLGNKKPADMPEIASTTYLVTMIDFKEPGELGVFVDEDQIALLESMMKGQGYLPANTMGATFAMLRGNDLIWSFVINNYLMGRDPFPFDMLTWNSDSTNLPETMQSYYLRNMYLNNNLIKPNVLSMKDVPIDLTKITTPAFCLSTHDDHITPWRSTYAATQTYSGPVTFCLSGSGHIAGVVNPPAKKKYGYWTNGNERPANPNEWLKNAKKNEGSWWPEWTKWLEQYAGEMITARDPATNTNVIEDAPGSYVRKRAI